MNTVIFVHFRERRGPDIHQVLPVPQVLRSHPHLGQARRLRHAAPSQEGLLRPRLQRGEGGAALGLGAAEVRLGNVGVKTLDSELVTGIFEKRDR